MESARTGSGCRNRDGSQQSCCVGAACDGPRGYSTKRGKFAADSLQVQQNDILPMKPKYVRGIVAFRHMVEARSVDIVMIDLVRGRIYPSGLVPAVSASTSAASA